MSQAAPPSTSPIRDYSPAIGPAIADDPRLIGKIIVRLIPFLCLLFVVNYLDRTNIAMAKLQMLGDTNITEEMYGFGAGLFFIGYFIFEVPSNLILERVGARVWMTRIMITWGLICSAMMFVRGPQSFYGLRFLLGVAEAGFFPGIVLYLTYWIPSHRRSSVMAWFLASTAISGVIGNPLAGALMKINGVGGLHGWQWLFLLEGIAPVLLGFATLALLPDRPRNARWLNAGEIASIESQLAAEQAEHPAGNHVAELATALRDLRLWMLGALYFMLIMGEYGFIYWAPTIIKNASGASDMNVGWLSAIPYLAAACTMIAIGHRADRVNERRWHIAVCAVFAAGSFVVVSQCHTTRTVLPALCLTAIGSWGSLAPFWTLSTRFLRGTAAAGGIAIVNSIGALAGFAAPSVIGWAKAETGSFTGGLIAVAAALVCGAVLVLLVPRAVDRDS